MLTALEAQKDNGERFHSGAEMTYLTNPSTSKNCWLGSKPCCAAVTGPKLPLREKRILSFGPLTLVAGAIRGDPGSTKPCGLTHLEFELFTV